MQDSQPATRARPWRCAVFFWHASPNDEAALDGIRQALADRRHPHQIDVDRANADPAEAAKILARLARERPDVIFAMGTQAALLAGKAIVDIPVVFTAVTDPVESGVVRGWEGSGTNVAGNSNWIAPETLLHVFRLAVPGLQRLGMLRSKDEGVVSAAELRDMRRSLAQSGSPGLEIVEEVVARAEDLPAAVRRLAAARVQAIWVPIDFTIYRSMAVIAEAACYARTPVLTSSLQAANGGAVAGVVVDYVMLGQQAVVIALQILERGARPGDLPIGKMRGYKVVVNLECARACGYQLPLPMLALAEVLHDSPVTPADDGPARR